MNSPIEKILISKAQIENKVLQLGQKISEDYRDKNPLLVGLLKGSIVFMADLMRNLDINCNIDFICVSSYANGVKSSGVVKIIKDLDADINSRDVLVIEDILDSGLTLSYILKLLKSRNPASIRLCTLLDKPQCRKVPVSLDYCGFEIPDEFVVGYGLDYNEKYRNLPYIAVLSRKEYADKQ